MHGKLVLILAVAGTAAVNCWSQQYTLVNLGTLGGNYSVGFAINDSNQVAGTSSLPQVNGSSADHPFLYSNGTMMDLGTLGGTYGLGYAINAAGHVVGYSEGADGQDHAFLWNGAAQNLTPGLVSYGSNLNDNDNVVLTLGPQQPGGEGYVYKSGVLDPLPHGSYTRILPSGINNAGKISGSCQTDYSGPNRACSVVSGVLKTLGSGGNSSTGYAMNQAGDICGYSLINAHTVATLWRSGSRIGLGRLSNGYSSQCAGLNDFAQEVGYGNNGPNFGSPLRAVLFDPVNGAQNLNALTVRPTGWVLTQATGINNRGAIIAVCLINGKTDRACLLKPNAVLILKKNILALAVNDPGCTQCVTVLKPEAESLPQSLSGLTSAQQKTVTATVETMIGQLSQLLAASQISARQDQLLEHQGHLVLEALHVE